MTSYFSSPSVSIDTEQTELVGQEHLSASPQYSRQYDVSQHNISSARATDQAWIKIMGTEMKEDPYCINKLL